MKIADLNFVNLARASLGTVAAFEAGTVEDQPFTVASTGVLLPLEHIAPTQVVVKKGTDAASAQAVPTLGHAGLVVLSGLVAGAAALRRRKPAKGAQRLH